MPARALAATAAALALAAVTLLITLAPATAWALTQAAATAIGYLAASAMVGALFAVLSSFYPLKRDLDWVEARLIILPFFIVGTLTGAILWAIL